MIAVYQQQPSGKPYERFYLSCRLSSYRWYNFAATFQNNNINRIPTTGTTIVLAGQVFPSIGRKVDKSSIVFTPIALTSI
jgi:hypothetical protein